MQVTKILILTEAPFTKRDYDRFGVDLLRKNFRVSILDCTPWLKPEFWKKYAAIAYNCSGYRQVPDFQSFVSNIELSANAIAIDFLGACANSRIARIELKKRHILRAVFLQGHLPRAKVNSYERVRLFIHSNTPLSVLRKVARRGARVVYREPAPDLSVLSGAASLKDVRMRGSSRRVWAHSFDYDVYLNNADQHIGIGERYAVFLDEDMAFHPDYDHAGIQPPTTPDKYYPVMNRFFERFERANGMRVIIAAHPRSLHELRPGLWGGRALVRNKTAQLVRGADYVLGHATTSLSFAVLWRKPILFLSTNDLERSYLGPLIALRSHLLRRPLIILDERLSSIPNRAELPSVDEDAYASYIAEFIKLPGTPDKPAWQIFSEFVTRDLQ